MLLDDEALYYRRVEYDIEVTIQKIHAIPELDNFLGDHPARRSLTSNLKRCALS